MSKLEKIKTFDEEAKDIKTELAGYRNIIISEDGQYIDINLYVQCKTIYEQMVNSAILGNSFGCNKYLNQSIMIINIRNGNIAKKITNINSVVPVELEYFINEVKNGEDYFAICPTYDEDNLNTLLMKVEDIFTKLLENIDEAICVEGKKQSIELYLKSINFVLNKYFRKDNMLPDFSDENIRNIMSSILIECVRNTYIPDLKSGWITTKEASIISGLPIKKIRYIFIENGNVIAKKNRNSWYLDLQSFIEQYSIWLSTQN